MSDAQNTTDLPVGQSAPAAAAPAEPAAAAAAPPADPPAPQAAPADAPTAPPEVNGAAAEAEPPKAAEEPAKKTHKAAIYDKPGTISTKIVDVETPEPGPGEVLVQL
jgi:hypothetical protein